MSCFSTVSAITADSELDLTKHVNFTSGMILGVDDFTQEFSYLAGRDRWLARDALGYGTISGLGVRIEKDAEKGHRVMILPGVAVSRRGQFICVPSPQCAYLNQWLAANNEELNKRLRSGSPPVASPPSSNEIMLYVTLCYRDCLADNVPIPGEPCRSEDELTAASRVKDDYSLELRFDAPKQPEEKAVRGYVEWLKKIKITAIDSSTKLDKFLQAIRDKWLSPVSPPSDALPSLQINTKDFCEYMREAFRLWVTELRNVLSDRKTGCGIEMTGGGNLDDCVLLAKIRIPLEPLAQGWKVSDTKKVETDETHRPFLLHLRMLQEWMLCGLSRTEGTHPPVTSPNFPTGEHSHTLHNLSDVEAASPSNGQVLTFRDNLWIPENLPASPGTPPTEISLDNLSDVTIGSVSDGNTLVFRNNVWGAETPATTGGITDHGELSGLGDDDHLIYLPRNGSRAMEGSLNVGGNLITNLAPGTTDGEAVIFQQAIKQEDTAGGDLSGTYPKPTVNQLQGTPLNVRDANVGDALTWNGRAWIPQRQTTTQQAAEPFLILPLATITRTEAFIYEVWFNIDAPGNLAEIRELTPEHLKIFDETAVAPTFRAEIAFAAAQVGRNVFQVNLRQLRTQVEPDRMRFDFNVRLIRVEAPRTSLTLFEFAERERIKFPGFLKGDVATIFVRGSGVRNN